MNNFTPRPMPMFPQPLTNWTETPSFNYHPVHNGMFAPETAGVVTPMPVPDTPRPTSVLGISVPFSKLLNFPSPMQLFNRPRNIFGA